MRIHMHRFGTALRVTVSVLALLLLLGSCTPVSRPTDTTEAPTTEAAPPDSESGTETSPLGELSPPPEDSPLPVLSIVTDDGKPITSARTYKEATVTVTGAPYAHHNVTLRTEIRGRGHSSFDGKADQDEYASKNSYRLKLATKTNLLGIGETADRDWVLISGKYDVSALRNYLVWDLARRLGTIPYVPTCTWVNVYVNGDFRGMYSLVEKIEVASDRVDIDESACVNPDGVGYLLEYDLRGAYDTGAVQGLTYFYVPGLDETFAWSIKSEIHSTEVTAAIRDHIITCNEAILSGDRERMETYVDMASFVDMFILQEFSKNPDAGCSSFYMQRDAGGKLCLTAPWDFDFALGSYSVSVPTSGLVADGEGVMSHPWFEFLTTQPWFMSLVLERLEEIKPLVEETLTEVRRMAVILEPAADQNDLRWNLYGEKFSVYPANQVSVDRISYDDHVDFLVEWADVRLKNLIKAVRKLAD